MSVDRRRESEGKALKENPDIEKPKDSCHGVVKLMSRNVQYEEI
jgi:hypothetical protein